jgi:hypothetical protein
MERDCFLSHYSQSLFPVFLRLTLNIIVGKMSLNKVRSTSSDALFGFLNVIRHGVGLLWTRDQLVEKASTDTGQHNIQTQERKIHAPRGIRTLDLNNKAAKTYALDCVATGIGETGLQLV